FRLANYTVITMQRYTITEGLTRPFIQAQAKKLFVLILVFCFVISVGSDFPFGHASASTPQAVVGMPFVGQWAWNANVMQPFPPYVDSCPNGESNCPGLSSHPSVHHTPGGGNWATDVYAGE